MQFVYLVTSNQIYLSIHVFYYHCYYFSKSSLVSCVKTQFIDSLPTESTRYQRVSLTRFLIWAVSTSPEIDQLWDFFSFDIPHPNLATLVIEENTPPLDNINKTISKANCCPKLRYLYIRKNSSRCLCFALKKASPILKHLSDNNVDIAKALFVICPIVYLTYLFRTQPHK